MGGGTEIYEDEDSYWYGLSPRGRGNPLNRPPDGILVRSIPVWAGEPATPTYRICRGGRGNHRLGTIFPTFTRSIPAWAGEPRVSRPCRRTSWVYPRVGGGTALTGMGQSWLQGLSPRGRGNRVDRYGPVLASGSIPAWAGEQGLNPFAKEIFRSIPAWAGEPLRHHAQLNPLEVYPRVGGGTVLKLHLPMALQGLSPRGRGNRVAADGWRRLRGSIPAWAGEPGSR